MKIRTSRSAAVVVVLVSLVAGVLAAVAPSASATGPEITVIWPEATQLNRHDFSVDIEWDGSGAVKLVGWPRESATSIEIVPSPGPFSPNFLREGHNGDWRFAVVWCPSADEWTGCDWHYSAPMTLWGEFELRPWLWPLGPNQREWVYLEPEVDTPVDVDWALLDGETVVAKGAFEATGSGFYTPRVGPQPSLVPGSTYTFNLTVRGDAGPYGVLVGSSTGQVVWDTEVQVDLSKLHVGAFRYFDDVWSNNHVFYPVKDDYRDVLSVATRDRSIDFESLSVEVHDANDEVVFSTGTSAHAAGDVVEWNGRDPTGKVLPEGVYDVQVRLRDVASNVLVVHRPIRLSHKVLTPQTWRRTLLPGQAVKDVDSLCGWLKTPARRRWADSVGYYTKFNCPGGTHVETSHRIRVPDSPTGRYGRIRILVIGGQARGETDAQLGYRVWNTDAPGYSRGGSFAGNLDQHRGKWVRALPYDERGRLVVGWTLFTERGDRYDVLSVTVEAEIEVLAEPGR